MAYILFTTKLKKHNLIVLFLVYFLVIVGTVYNSALTAALKTRRLVLDCVNPSDRVIDLDPTKGAEIQKKRPAIIVNDDALGKLPLKVIVPITDWKDRYDIAPWMVKIEPNTTNGLSKTSSADCFQIRSLSQERLIKKLGNIDAGILDDIKEAVRKVLDL